MPFIGIWSNLFPSSKEEPEIKKEEPMAKEIKLFVCELCKEPIMAPNKGVLITGNIRAADPETGQLYVGVATPTGKESVAYHTACLNNILTSKKI